MKRVKLPRETLAPEASGGLSAAAAVLSRSERVIIKNLSCRGTLLGNASCYSCGFHRPETEPVPWKFCLLFASRGTGFGFEADENERSYENPEFRIKGSAADKLGNAWTLHSLKGISRKGRRRFPFDLYRLRVSGDLCSSNFPMNYS